MDAPPPITFGGETLVLSLTPGETAWLRRSSLILAEGPFQLSTHKIAKRRFSVIGAFSGQVRWANKFTAEDAPVHLMAGRDFNGTVAHLTVTPDHPVYLQPGLYLGHSGDLTFNTERVAKKEFWTLTRASGNGIVHIKLPGTPTVRPLTADAAVVDTNYVAAIAGPFDAHGKVFTASELMKSGEMENVRLSGHGHVLFQSHNPEEMGGGGGGGIFGLIGDLLPF